VVLTVLICGIVEQPSVLASNFLRASQGGLRLAKGTAQRVGVSHARVPQGLRFSAVLGIRTVEPESSHPRAERPQATVFSSLGLLPVFFEAVVCLTVASLLLRTRTGHASPSSRPVILTASVESAATSHSAPATDATLCCSTCQLPLAGNACPRCQLRYADLGGFLDLTPGSGVPLQSAPKSSVTPSTDNSLVPALEGLERMLPLGPLPRLSRLLRGEYAGERRTWGKNVFESPVVAQIYERGWRQSMGLFGIPGPDAEYRTAMRWLLPVAAGRRLLDLSCGPGVFTRRFVASDSFASVVALDFSESMLRQTQESIEADSDLRHRAAGRLTLVRGDVSRLPLGTGSVAAVHAGAAIHCWPYPGLAMAEVSRVLRPGGRAVLSTLLYPGQDVPILTAGARALFFDPIVPEGIRFWDPEELRDLCARVGLTAFEAERHRDFIIFKVDKPLEQSFPAPSGRLPLQYL